ncbi:hypothetical protein F610DRAFT_06831 [Streptomyces sp. LaPpAH-199]|uniref:hypothetical protein n=1 Tax=Streptomyces TaxID=1883 RepID=UPI0008912892|nr:hypothetical protein [Streptomyces sp. LaPpAH-199]MYW77701.1 hypothetical protein [Streptomyces sp. SID8369]SDE32703.1 hypothetical protein F610DRAFT_06831 [Streptomyces sp. LaPpAH-199]
MADTATAPPDTTAGGTTTEETDTAEYTVVTEPSETSDPAPEQKKTSRGRPQALPLLVHGTNATGIATGIAYGVAGVPGLIAAGAAGVAVAAAALAGRKKRSKVSAARRAAAANCSGGGSGRAGGGAGKGGLLGRGGGRGRSGGGGAGGGRMNNRSGRLNGTGSKMNGTGKGAERRPGGGTGGSGSGKNGRGLGGLLGKGGGRGKGGLGGGAISPGANTPKGAGGKNGPGGSSGGGKAGAGQQSRTGKAWQTLKGRGNKMRRKNGGGSGTGSSGSAGSSGGFSGSGSGSSGKGTTPAKSRLGRAMQKMRGWAGKLRRSKKGKGGTSGGSSSSGTKAGSASGRLYRMRRTAARKLGHWARCAGAGFLAGLGGLLTLPLGILWGTWRLLTKHRDPLAGFAFPVRTAGRIWRFFFRRSKARHDKEAKADQLNLTVNDSRKDTDPMTGPSLAAGTTVLDGNNSKFALAMRATHSAYTGYSPTSMMEVAAEYAGLPNGIRAAAMAVQQMAVNSDQKYPCSKRAIAKLTETYQRMVNAASRAENMVALFRFAHAFDIERIVAPRTNEWMWNVTPNGSSASETAMFQPGRIESGCVLMAVLYRTFDPVHMLQVGSEYQGIGYGLNALADAIEALHQRTRDLYPVDDRVTDELGTLVQMIRAAADDAEMAAKLFLEDHRLEISHNTNPRKGPAAESMWNTPR